MTKICSHCGNIYDVPEDDCWLCSDCRKLDFAPEFERRLKRYQEKSASTEYSDDDLAHELEYVFAVFP